MWYFWLRLKKVLDLTFGSKKFEKSQIDMSKNVMDKNFGVEKLSGSKMLVEQGLISKEIRPNC